MSIPLPPPYDGQEPWPPPVEPAPDNAEQRGRIAWTVIIAIAVVFLVSQTTDAFAGIGNGAATIIAVVAALLVLLVRALIRVGDKRPPPVVITQPTAPPPGWYPDARQTGMLRWFDGHVWTDHTQRPPTV